MGNCIICGKAVDGQICDSHEEDAVFEFEGTEPSQLTPNRFYRGTVDGYADFGVFVNLSRHVTGLLHRSKLDRRLESLDWEVGDTVFVQVTNVRDNGDVDLSWSIRQSEREFRGVLVDHPERGEYEPEAAAEAEQAEEVVDQAEEATEEAETVAETSEDAAETNEDVEETAGTATAEREVPEERTAIDTLRARVGEAVRIEGEVVSARQTSGPTVFELRDETGTVDCAAFVEAGVRAYPEVETGDVVRLDGEVRTRRDELQVETETLVVLEDEERETVVGRMEDALTARAEPDVVEPLAGDDAIDTAAVSGVATTIRRAVLESRPVVVRHPATADGYVAGAAIERAVLPLVDDEHGASSATYHYFDRRPLEDDVYDMDDATKDVTRMLDDQQRHGEKYPLFVFVGAGTTTDSADGLGLLDVYDVPRLVVGGEGVADEVAEAVAAAVTASDSRTAGAVAASVAAAVNDEVRADLEHLPAVSYWEDAPEAYVELARNAGYDDGAIDELREAIALEAYYQAYEDKRELIVDLLFGEDEGEGRGLAAQVSEQFRAKLEDELETAEANLERRQANGTDVSVLDADAFTHRFDFPPADVLLDELHRRTRGETPVTVGVADDELRLRSETDVDLRAVAAHARETVPNAGITTRGGRLEFLTGERDAVVDAVVDAIAAEA